MRPLVLTVAAQRQAVRLTVPHRGKRLIVAILPLVRERTGPGREPFPGLGALAWPSGPGRFPHQASVVVTLDEAERGLLEAVMQGMTVVAYAAQAGIRESTARFHARGLLQKAGVKRLADLGSNGLWQ